jgi:nucleotide-binding universal stress UspA family protein
MHDPGSMVARFVMVCGVDLESPTTPFIIEQAIEIGRTAAAIHVVSVVEPEPTLLRREPGDAEQIRRHAQALEPIASQIATAMGPDCTLYVHARWGDPAETMVHVGAEAKAQLIVLGAPRFQRTFHGSVSEKVAQWAGCPVLVARDVDWEIEMEGLVPHLALCPDCIEARKDQQSPHWLCKVHQAPTLRVVRIVRNLGNA